MFCDRAAIWEMQAHRKLGTTPLRSIVADPAHSSDCHVKTPETSCWYPGSDYAIVSNC